MKVTKYDIFTDKINTDLKIACVSDVHGRQVPDAIYAVKKIKPDIILLAGDILEVSTDYMEQRNKNSLHFLKQMAGIAPCFYCFGNHEVYYSHAHKNQSHVSDGARRKQHIEEIEGFGIHIVNNIFEELGNALIGGVVCGYDKDPDILAKTPDMEFLNSFDEMKGLKILICHYPHYYERFLKNTSFDLIVSGHAHGGQWRIFGRGVYAPHQGLFPKYTSGIYDNRFIISRGACNNEALIPRFFNPCEVLEINIKHKK